MKLILNYDDIKETIMEHYQGVQSISSEDQEITIEVTIDKSILSKRKEIVKPKPFYQDPETTPVVIKTAEDKIQEAVNKGLMVPGGQERSMIRF